MTKARVCPLVPKIFNGISVTSPRLALIVAGTGGGGADATRGARTAPCAAGSKIKPAASSERNSNEAREMKIEHAVKNNFGFGGTNGTLVFKRV